MLLIDASVATSKDAPLAVGRADDNAAKCGEWGEVHGLRHSNALIADLFSWLLDPTVPSIALFPGNNASVGETDDGWNGCEPWVGDIGGDEEE